MPELYYEMTLKLEAGKEYKRKDFLVQLVDLQYQRNDIAFERGSFRVVGENIDVFDLINGKFKIINIIF